MPSIASLVPKLVADFPQFTFVAGERFDWQPEHQTITYVQESSDSAALLHELAHARLDHRDFGRDVTLLEMERDAWQLAATTLAPRYDMTVTADAVEDALDTYRDWLHARSTCPACRATGVQIKQQTYRCLACRSEWTVNDARQYALRRHLTTK